MPRDNYWTIVVPALLALAGSTFGGEVTIIVTNAQAITTSGPDTELARDLFQYLGERDLSTLAFHEKAHSTSITPQDLAMTAIALASPDRLQKFSIFGSRATVGPVDDFNRFVDAIDYGRVIARDEKQWTVRIEMDPAVVSEEALRARLSEVADPPYLASRKLFAEGGDSRLGGLIDGGFNDRRVSPPPGFGHNDEPLDEVEVLGGSFAVGDFAEIDLGRKPIAVEIVELKDARLDRINARVELFDREALVKLIRSRSLKQRLEKAETFSFWTPVSKLRRLPGPPAPKPVERTWTDITGRFKIDATFDGLEGDKVVLRKANGKTTKVPLGKLSEADRVYAEGLASKPEDNPFATASGGFSKSLRADWSGVRKITPRRFSRWNFNPTSDAAPPAAQLTATSMAVDSPNEGNAIFHELERVYISANGATAVAVISGRVGIDKFRHLQLLDFASGKRGPLVRCPPKSEVLDVSAETGEVLLKSDGLARDNTRLFIYRIEGDQLKPSTDWESLPPNSFHKKLEDARFLAGGRILVHYWTENVTIWDRNAAKALYTFAPGSLRRESTFVGPNKRFLFLGASKAIAIFDTATGEHVASLDWPLPAPRGVSADPDLNRIAIATSELVATFDLNTGELIEAIRGGLIQQGRVNFVGDFLLIDDHCLVAPEYPLLLWHFAYRTTDRRSAHAQMSAGRLWYAVRGRGFDGGGLGSWYIASTPMPSDAISRRLATIGDLDDLVILDAGDKVQLVADTDLDPATEATLTAHLEASLVELGYQVVPNGGPGVKQAAVVCKRAEQPVEVLVFDENAKAPKDRLNGWAQPPGKPPRFPRFPDEWRFKKRSVRPYQSMIEVRYEGEVLWTDRVAIYEGQRLFPRVNESIDDVVKRLEAADTKRLLNLDLPGRMCRRGDVDVYGDIGAYGASLLGSEGVEEDHVEGK